MTRGETISPLEYIGGLYTDLKIKAVAAISLGLGAILGGGCQSAQVCYYGNPQNSSFMVREMGRAQGVMDEDTPRKYDKSFNKFKRHLGRIPFDVLEFVDSVFSIGGARPFRGRYFGTKIYGGVFNSKNKNAINYQPLDTFEGGKEDYAEYGLIHFPNAGINVIGSGLKTLGDVMGVGGQAINMVGVLPITANTSRRAKFIGEKGKDNPENDSLEFLIDGGTDILKVPVRGALYVIGNADIPKTWKNSWYGVREWAGMEIRPASEKTDLEDFFCFYPRDEEGFIDRRETKDGRVLLHGLPFFGNLDPWFYGTEFDKHNGEIEIDPSTIKEPLPTNLEEGYWEDVDPGKAPGVVLSGEEGNLFYPAGSGLLGLADIAITGAAALSNCGGGDGGVGGGGGGLGSAGGRTGGGPGLTPAAAYRSRSASAPARRIGRNR